MRNSSTLDVLFPRIRHGLLAALLAQPERWWYLSELATHLSTSPSSLQRELRALSASGLISTRREGRRTYFRADESASIFPELRGLFEKTAGIASTLRQLLERFGAKVKVAFIFGSIALKTERGSSDIDLLVVGEIGLLELTPVLREAEKRLNRKVNAVTYSPKEFRAKVRGGDHFIKSVLNRPVEFVKGGQSELGKLAGK